MNRLASVPSDAAAAPAVSAPAGTFVARITLTDFRCYARLRLDIDAASVVLTGPNGAGKTNLLEALSYLAPGRGLRRARLGDPDRRLGGGDVAGRWTVAAVVAAGGDRLTIGTGHEAEGQANGRRIVRRDGTALSGHKDLAEILSVVWLTPDMDALLRDGAAGRRAFLDRLACGFAPEHAGEVAAYQHCLRERARLLTERIGDAAWIAALEDGMARHGVAMAASRLAVVARLDRAARAGIGPFPAARLELSGDVEIWLRDMPALAAEDRLRAALVASREADAAVGGAAVGPHRADLAVYFAGRDVPAAQCSTGEQKALLLSIVLAHARELAAERGSPPVLLLDEVVAHLDGVRRAALFDEIAALGAQAWLTGTDEESFAGMRTRASFYKVLDSTVTQR